jgi:hypothetical protein
MSTIALGNYLRFYSEADALVYAFQNFYIGTTVTHEGITYNFAPFGFAGLSASREGELGVSTVTFANTKISRSILSEALRGGPYTDNSTWRRPYVVESDTNILDPEARTVVRKLFTYVGQATGGDWDDTALQLRLSSVLDASTPDVPTRTLHRRLVGALPLSSSVRI